MERYRISVSEVLGALAEPDEVVPGYLGRLVAHKYRGAYVLRVIYEKRGKDIIVVTVYRARRERYERR